MSNKIEKQMAEINKDLKNQMEQCKESHQTADFRNQMNG